MKRCILVSLGGRKDGNCDYACFNSKCNKADDIEISHSMNVDKIFGRMMKPIKYF